MTVDSIALDDTLTDLDGVVLALSSGPTFVSTDGDSAEGTLVPGETATYTASFTITQSEVDAGGVRNTVTASGTDPEGTPVSDVSDDGNDADGNTSDDPTETPIGGVAALEVTKTSATPSGTSVGSPINYTITVENTGNVTVDSIALDDTLTDLDGVVLALSSGPTFVSTDGDSAEGTLVPGETATYTASFTITQSEVDAGGVRNTVTASGTDPEGTPVSDVSDDGNDADGNTSDDPTETPIGGVAALEVTKTSATPSGTSVGSPINYTITVENTGNVTVDSIALDDTLTDLDGVVLALSSGPTFVSTDGDSAEGTLVPGETATYTASFTITQSEVDAGGVRNTVTASGTDPEGTPVSDVSDDGNDADGNTSDDPTETPIGGVAALEVTKTSATPSGTSVGSPINYTITVENTGNVTVDSIALDDTLTDLDGVVLALSSGPTFVSTDGDSAEGTLVPGETATYTASFTITQSEVDAGGVRNTVTASGTDPEGTPVSDVSDDGNDADGNTSDDPTETPIGGVAALEVTKTSATPSGTSVGSPINYTITVENTGNVTVDSIALDDTLTDLDGVVLALSSGPTFVSTDGDSAEGTLVPGETATYTASFTITQSEVDAGGVRNTVTASGTDPEGTPVSDVSDDGNDADGNTSDDPTETPIGGVAALEVTKTSATPSGTSVGSPINYTITVENTGNVTVDSIALDDTLTDLDGVVLALSSGPTFVSDGDSAEGTLVPGETATCRRLMPVVCVTR